MRVWCVGEKVKSFDSISTARLLRKRRCRDEGFPVGMFDPRVVACIPDPADRYASLALFNHKLTKRVPRDVDRGLRLERPRAAVRVVVLDASLADAVLAPDAARPPAAVPAARRDGGVRDRDRRAGRRARLPRGGRRLPRLGGVRQHRGFPDRARHSPRDPPPGGVRL